jgi:hypothetical protein
MFVVPRGPAPGKIRDGLPVVPHNDRMEGDPELRPHENKIQSHREPPDGPVFKMPCIHDVAGEGRADQFFDKGVRRLYAMPRLAALRKIFTANVRFVPFRGRVEEER